MDTSTQEPRTNAARELFVHTLTAHYRRLFETAEYAYAAARTTPESLAEKMTAGLQAETANKDGDGIKATCRDLKIAYTYKAIRQYLRG